MDKDQFDGILVLKLVSEKKSFAGAAKDLKISASAVSQIVKQLETRVGVALLARTTRRVNLTEAGTQFLNTASPGIEQILSAFAQVDSYAQKPSGLLRINLPKTVFWSYLAPAILGFRKEYPEVSVEVVLEDGPADLVREGFDAGIRLSDILVKDMVAVRLYGPVKFVTAASPKYLNKYGRPKHPRDLLQHDCIRCKRGDWMYDKWEFEHKGSEFQVQVKGTFILNDSISLLKAAAEGLGILYTDRNTIEQYVGKSKLEIVLESYAAQSAGYYLYYPKVSQVQPKLRAFIDYIKQYNKSL